MSPVRRPVDQEEGVAVLWLPYPEEAFPRYPTAQSRAGDMDRRLAERVAQRLSTVLPTTSRLRVRVQNRVVMLSGLVDSPRTAHAAAGYSWAIDDVYDVCNNLRWPANRQSHSSG
jgi:BON domain